MERNLGRRVEVLAPIRDAAIREQYEPKAQSRFTALYPFP
jgi:polyphosphate kinase